MVCAKTVRCFTSLVVSAFLASGQIPKPGLGGGGGGGSGSGAGTFCAATLSANVATCAGSPAPTTLTGLIGSLTVSAANTAAWTLNIAGLGAKSVLASDGSTPTANQVIPGRTYLFSYNGTAIIVTPSTVPSSSVSNVTPVTVAATGLNAVLVDGKTLPAALQYIAASTAGKVSGAGTGTEVFQGLDGATTRLTITVDASGNRSAVTYG